MSDFRQQQEIEEMGLWLESLWSEICDEADEEPHDLYNMGEDDEPE